MGIRNNTAKAAATKVASAILTICIRFFRFAAFLSRCTENSRCGFLLLPLILPHPFRSDFPQETVCR